MNTCSPTLCLVRELISPMMFPGWWHDGCDVDLGASPSSKSLSSRPVAPLAPSSRITVHPIADLGPGALDDRAIRIGTTASCSHQVPRFRVIVSNSLHTDRDGPVCLAGEVGVSRPPPVDSAILIQRENPAV